MIRLDERRIAKRRRTTLVRIAAASGATLLFLLLWFAVDWFLAALLLPCALTVILA